MVSTPKTSHGAAVHDSASGIETGGIPVNGEDSARFGRSLRWMLLPAVSLLVMMGFTAWAAWPIYQTPWMLLPIIVGTLIGAGAVGLWQRGYQRIRHVAPIALAAFLLLLVPVAVPSGFSYGVAGFFAALSRGLAAIFGGFKQLLTLDLPVGTYQAVLVPLYVVCAVCAAVATWLMLRKQRGSRWRVWAVVPLGVPPLWALIFGAVNASTPTMIGPLAIGSPWETLLWLALTVALITYVWFVSTQARRAALRRGREQTLDTASIPVLSAGDAPKPGGRSTRAHRVGQTVFGAAIAVLTVIAGIFVAPLVTPDERTALRSAVVPEQVITQQVSPLASYRASKSDRAIETDWFSLQSNRALPPRLRIAVLDTYDGTDFHVTSERAGKFSRFPSGAVTANSAPVTVTIDEGYQGVWAPVSPPLSRTPSFGGERAEALGDAFYVNRDLGAAILAPEGSPGLEPGDAYTVDMAATQPRPLESEPGGQAQPLDEEIYPELSIWLENAEINPSAAGLLDAAQRLRERGYLSHSLDQSEGHTLWSEHLSALGGTFVSSPGGHSTARIERMFKDLNEIQAKAGKDADTTKLVAAVGDDEQFATAIALIGRSMGYDTRVVVGVRTGEAGVPTGAEADGADALDAINEQMLQAIPPCDGVCTGENLAAWVEVRGADGQWATIDATPQFINRPVTVVAGEQLPEFPTIPEERDASQVDPPPGQSDDSSADDQKDRPDAFGVFLEVLRVLGLSLILLLSILVPILCIPLFKWWRARHRRNQADPLAKALGAWAELRDRELDDGAPLPVPALVSPVAAADQREPDSIWSRLRRVLRRPFARLTPVGAELSEAGGSRIAQAEKIGTPQAFEIAWRVDEAVFGPERIDDEAAEYLWELVDKDAQVRRDGASLWERIRRSYALRSLGVTIGRSEPRSEKEATPREKVT